MKSNCFGDNMAYNLDDPTAIPACKVNVVIGNILAPTQSLLQKWLRETHNIFISINVNYCYKIYNNDELYEESFYYNNYEEALEQGLQEALKLG